MFCKKCGKEIPDGSQFCLSCGQKLAEEPANSSVLGNKKLLWIIIGIAAAFLIVAIIFGVLILGKLGNNNSDDEGDIKTEETVEQSEEVSGDLNESLSDVSESEESVDAESEADIPAGDDSSSYLAERFPKLTAGYVKPNDDSCWITIDDDTRAKLDALDTDYNKITWIVEYAFKAFPTLVVSFTINENCGVTTSFVAFTNVGDKAVSIDGTADIYDFDDNKLFSGYPYIGMLQPGGTYICPISCPDADENNIDLGFTDLKLDFASAASGTYTSTASLGTSSKTNIITTISLENTCDRRENMGQVTVLLDELGFPVANGYVFSATSTDPGTSMDSDLTIGILEADIEKAVDVAVFASPYITQ